MYFGKIDIKNNKYLSNENKKSKYNVINIHCTDKCNFSCKHCFVKKENNEMDLQKAKICIDKIHDYFVEENIKNGRINLAGGEPLLYPYIFDLIDYINKKNIIVSIITNAFSINKELIDKFKNKVDIIGISVDALDKDTNRKIGRCNKNEVVIPDENFYIEKCLLIKKANIKLKVNICVSKLNINIDFSNFLENVNPDRLKIIQMICEEDINDNEYLEKLLVEDKEFKNFAYKYKKYDPVIENSDDLTDSYPILDSNYCICTINDHKSSNSLLDNDLKDCLEELNIDYQKFSKRYM